MLVRGIYLFLHPLKACLQKVTTTYNLHARDSNRDLANREIIYLDHPLLGWFARYSILCEA